MHIVEHVTTYGKVCNGISRTIELFELVFKLLASN